MNIDEIYEQIDRLYTQNDGAAVEELLLAKITEAVQSDEKSIVVQLLNELIGHYRETGEFDKCSSFCEKLLGILEDEPFKGTMAAATSYLNIANAYRAVGYLRESSLLYQQVKAYYDENVDRKSMLYASLYNNMALLFQEMGDYESAYDALTRALGISNLYPECRIEQASTHANIAATLVCLDRPADAENHLRQAFELFEMDEDPDYHYSAALSAMAELKFGAGQYEEAVNYYEKALHEVERHVGKSKAYEIILHNLEAARKALESGQTGDGPDSQELQDSRELQDSPGSSDEAEINKEENLSDIRGLKLCKKFYEEYGVSMIHDKFPEYESRIAAGLVGEGSECFGYDDDISRDHDFGPGFCMWLTDEDYELIGERLNEEYDRLPTEYKGITRLNTVNAGRRVGAFRISDFYAKLIGIPGAPQNENDWLYIDDERFASCVNGEVYRDDKGVFSQIRNEIKTYYPDPVWRRKIAQRAALMSQYGQYNYSRMLSRGDIVTAQICLGDFMKETMRMVYLLNRRYAPYYKWIYKGLEDCVILPQVRDEIKMIAGLKAGDEEIPELIEEICSQVLDELKRQHLTDGADTYLDHHVRNILGAKTHGEDGRENVKGTAEDEVKEAETMAEKEDLIEKIVALEWEAFDKVQNQGGRASCQDDYSTFSIMRKSQYLLWDSEMLESFIGDFLAAKERGWNLITEKYGRMEESTAPAEYDKIKDSMPPLSEEKKQIIEAVVAIQVGMMEEFAKDYPKSAGNARSIHTYEDNPYNTSYETYLRGEISTYSDDTLALYGRFVAGMAKAGRNIAHDTIENSAILYGYKSLDDMESRL